MLLLGLTGPIGHGKSTLAAALRDLEPQSTHLESSMVIAEVANELHASTHGSPDPTDIDAINRWLRPLPVILLRVVHARCNFDQIKIDKTIAEQHPAEYEKLFLHLQNLKRDPTLLQGTINRDNKERYRPILQWLGGYLVQKVDQGIWYKELIRRAYTAETNGTKLCIVGGLRFPTDAALIRQAGGFVVKVYRPAHLQDDILDPTERERENIRVDSVVASNGTVEDAYKFAPRFLEDLNKGQLQRQYQTADYHELSSAGPEE